jgi:hypothetical protein
MMAPTVKTTPIMAETLVNAAQSRIAPESGLSTAIAARLEDTETRAARGPLVSADTIMAVTHGAIHRADNPVSAADSAAVEDSMAAVAADIIASRLPTLFKRS